MRFLHTLTSIWDQKPRMLRTWTLWAREVRAWLVQKLKCHPPLDPETVVLLPQQRNQKTTQQGIPEEQRSRETRMLSWQFRSEGPLCSLKVVVLACGRAAFPTMLYEEAVLRRALVICGRSELRVQNSARRDWRSFEAGGGLWFRVDFSRMPRKT